MRKLTFAVAVLASLAGGGLATSVSAAPGAPIGVTGPGPATYVYMTPMERRMMRNRMERRMMRDRMERRMMKRDMMRDRMQRRMMRNM